MCFPALSARDFLERARKGKGCKGMNTGNKSENQMFILDKKDTRLFFPAGYGGLFWLVLVLNVQTCPT